MAGTDPGAPPLTALVEDVGFLLARTNALSLAAGNAALAAHGLKTRSYAVLALAADGGRSQRELAEYLRLDPSQVVALVDDLQRRGLVTRTPDPADRRANIVVATDEGRELCGKAACTAREADERLLRALDESERAQLAALLRRTAFPED